jgi:hypothetical protein
MRNARRRPAKAGNPAIQASVDAQLMERGAFSPLELLIDTGRLAYGDYERWRRGEVRFLDEMLMGSRNKIEDQLRLAVSYARSIGLVETAQEFHAWQTPATEPASSDVTAHPLKVSEDRAFHDLVVGRYTPAQAVPQMDLFFHNPVVALANGIVQALSAGHFEEAQRQLDRLYEHEPNHADLPAFDRLVAALGARDRPIADVRQELEHLQALEPSARQLMGSKFRDLLVPLWRRLAAALSGARFQPQAPELHASFALSHAQDWTGVRASVLAEPKWWEHLPLCLRLAQSAFHRRQHIEALTAWCHICWRAPEEAARLLDGNRHPYTEVALLWQDFAEFADDADVRGAGSVSAGEPPLSAADFPAWLLLHDPLLHRHLPADLPPEHTPGEQAYRITHGLTYARRSGNRTAEMNMRKELQAHHPALFRFLKHTLAARD